MLAGTKQRKTPKIADQRTDAIHAAVKQLQQDNSNGEAQAALYKMLKSQVYCWCYSITKHEEDAKDYAHDAFLRLFNKIAQFRWESKFTTWFHRLTRNLVLMDRRRLAAQFHAKMMSIDAPMKIYGEREKAGGIGLRMDLGKEDASLRLAESGLGDRLTTAIGNLSATEHAAFVLADIEKHNYQEISEMLNTSVPAVKSRILRARRHLQENLRDYGKSFRLVHA